MPFEVSVNVYDFYTHQPVVQLEQMLDIADPRQEHEEAMYQL